MSSIRFIHTADIHLDTPFKGLTNLPGNLIEQVRRSTFKVFDKIVDYCIQYEVDFLLIAGDLYDSEDKSLKAQIHLLRGFEKLDAHGISTYIIHGNHDPFDKNTQLINWPKSVNFLSPAQVESLVFYKNGQEAAIIFGRSYPTKVFKENIVAEYKVNKPDVFNIGLLHTNVDGDRNHDTYAPCSLTQLIDSEIDYWALGHIHKSNILSNHSPAIVYPGNPQGRHINEDGLKGCYLVEINNKAITSLEMLPTSEIVWLKQEINLSQAVTFEDVLNIIQEELETLSLAYNLPLILELDLIGSTSLHNELHRGDRVQEIKELINETNSTTNPWLWLEDITLKTRPLVSKEEILAQNGFLSDFIKQFEQAKTEINKDSELYQELAAELFRNRSVRKHLLSFTDDDLDEVLDEVLNMAYDFFLEEVST